MLKMLHIYGVLISSSVLYRKYFTRW